MEFIHKLIKIIYDLPSFIIMIKYYINIYYDFGKPTIKI